jgi:methyl coenzyme M reductase beta subunit
MAAPKAIRFERTGIRQIDQMQREIADAFAVLLSSPFVVGQAIRKIALVGGTPSIIQHGLGYAPRNVIQLYIVGITAWQVTQPTATTMTLTAASSCSLDVWVS